MIDTSDFRNGLSIIFDGDLYSIVEFQHVKPGKGGAFVRTKLKNLRTQSTLERTFRAGEKFDQAILDRKKMNFLYHQDDEYVFMDMESFDQVAVPAASLGTGVKYLKDGTEVEVVSHNERIISAELPMFMEFEIVETDPGLRGDTASGGSKPATVETGAVISVPLFVNVGDRVKVDTRSDSYLERVK